MRSEDRKKSHGEVFTPPMLVNQMLDWLPTESWSDHTKTFCDPTCGNGNFLIEVIRRKIEASSTPEQALSTTYGVDLLPDNITEAHVRLLTMASEVSEIEPTFEWAKIVVTNVVCHDALTYDWEFTPRSETPALVKYCEILVEKVKIEMAKIKVTKENKTGRNVEFEVT